jgi:hypothetical protein
MLANRSLLAKPSPLATPSARPLATKLAGPPANAFAVLSRESPTGVLAAALLALPLAQSLLANRSPLANLLLLVNQLLLANLFATLLLVNPLATLLLALPSATLPLASRDLALSKPLLLNLSKPSKKFVAFVSASRLASLLAARLPLANLSPLALLALPLAESVSA